jgi:hypothetical protein
VFRTILYPVTAILGPFANDAIGQVFKNPLGEEGDGFSRLGVLQASCSSRVLELEADLVGLRFVSFLIPFFGVLVTFG